MYALHALLHEQHKNEMWQHYTANMLFAVAKTLAPRLQIKQYGEIINTAKKPVDERTGAEILHDVTANLKQRISRRKEHTDESI